MILLEALGTRFAPLEAELTTRAMQDLMNFHRNNGEGIDQLLIRFDMIRNRAVQRGGMAMTHQGLGWLLMRAIGLSIDQWDRVTDVLGGRMPENEFEFQRICDRLRRLGHSQEPGSHMRAGAARDYFGDTNMNGMNEYYFPTFDGNSNQQLALAAPTQAAYMMNNQQYLAAGADTSHYPTGTQEENFLPFPDEQCAHCGSFFEEEFSSGTESEDDAPIPQAAIYQTLAQGDVNNTNDLMQAIF